MIIIIRKYALSLISIKQIAMEIQFHEHLAYSDGIGMLYSEGKIIITSICCGFSLSIYISLYLKYGSSGASETRVVPLHGGWQQNIEHK